MRYQAMSRLRLYVPLIVLFMLVLAIPHVDMLSANAQTSAPFRVYFTFEDGPTDAYTPEILDILAKYNAKATFFVAGWQVAGHEAILQRIIREGHSIGNHLWVEPKLYAGAPDDDVRASYLKTEAAIRAALGPELPRYDMQVKLFRQPGGGAKPFPATPGIQVISYNWNVDSDDCLWKVDSTTPIDEQVLDNVLTTPKSLGYIYNVYDYGDGAIIVMHDINRVTGRVLPIILEQLQHSSATFKALPRPGDQIGTMPVALAVPPAYSPGFPGQQYPAQVIKYGRLRSAPNTGASILLDNVPPNTPLTVTGRSTGWYQVIHDGINGWIVASNVVVVGPIPNLPLIKP